MGATPLDPVVLGGTGERGRRRRVETISRHRVEPVRIDVTRPPGEMLAQLARIGRAAAWRARSETSSAL